MLSFLKPKIHIGLDIQPDEVRLLQLRRTKQYCCIEKFSITDLPKDAIVDGQIKDLAAVKSAIKELVTETQTKGAPTTIALPSHNLITKRITLPKALTEEECEEEISMNLNSYFPGIATELCFDFHILRSDTENHAIFLIAARVEQLNDYLQAVNEAGLTVKIVDSSLLALLRTIKLIHSQNEIIGILDINFTSSQLIIIKNQDVLFSQQLIIKSSEDLIQQFNQALNLWLTSRSDTQCAAIYLSGDDKSLKPAVVYLQNQWKLKIVYPNLFSVVRKSPLLNSSQFADEPSRMILSCGLALRSMSL